MRSRNRRWPPGSLDSCHQKKPSGEIYSNRAVRKDAVGDFRVQTTRTSPIFIGRGRSPLPETDTSRWVIVTYVWYYRGLTQRSWVSQLDVWNRWVDRWVLIKLPKWQNCHFIILENARTRRTFCIKKWWFSESKSNGIL